MYIEQYKNSRFIGLLIIADCISQDNREKKDVLQDNRKKKGVQSVIWIRSNLIRPRRPLIVSELQN